MKHRVSIVFTAWLGIWCLYTCGCDDTDDEDQPVDAGQDSLEETLCRDMINQLCTRSCSCGVAASICMYYYQSEDLSTQYPTMEECTAIEGELNCIGNLAGKDFNACILGLQTALCGELFGEPGLELPTACEELVQ